MEKSIYASCMMDTKQDVELNVSQFAPGIRKNIVCDLVEWDQTYNAINLAFSDDTNAKCSTRIFEPRQDNEKSYKPLLTKRFKLLRNLATAFSYPKECNPAEMCGNSWEDSCMKLLAYIGEHFDEDEPIKMAGVFVYNNKNYVEIRQNSFQKSICAMQELDDLGIEAEKMFIIDPKWDKIEPVKLNLVPDLSTPTTDKGKKIKLPF